MDKYKDLVADLEPYKQYLPMLKEYFTLSVEEKKVCEEMIKMLSCKTDEQVAQIMNHSRAALRTGGYTWQFDKAALKRFFDSLVTECEKQQKWTKAQWRQVAFKAAQQLEKQQEKLQEERQKVGRAVSVAGFAAERGATKARPTATDTKSRLHDFGEAARQLQNKATGITSGDIDKLQTILTGKRINDYTA